MNRQPQGLRVGEAPFPSSKPSVSFLLTKHKLSSHHHQLNAPALRLKLGAWNEKRALSTEKQTALEMDLLMERQG